jgi:hypothetical protein
MSSKNITKPKYEHVNVYGKEVNGIKNQLLLDKEIDKWGWTSLEWGTTEQWRKKKRFPYPNNKSVRLHRMSKKQNRFVPYYVFNFDETIPISEIDIFFVDVYKKR